MSRWNFEWPNISSLIVGSLWSRFPKRYSYTCPWDGEKMTFFYFGDIFLWLDILRTVFAYCNKHWYRIYLNSNRRLWMWFIRLCYTSKQKSSIQVIVINTCWDILKASFVHLIDFPKHVEFSRWLIPLTNEFMSIFAVRLIIFYDKISHITLVFKALIHDNTYFMFYCHLP